jgi:hypothetical protein
MRLRTSCEHGLGSEGKGSGARGCDLVAVGDSVFDLREACGCAGDRGPVRSFVSEKGVVDVAKAVGAAAQGGAKIGGNGKSRQHLIDGAFGNREQAHKEQIGALAGMPMG